ncbi:MAG: hypothetical protein ABI553_03350 [Chloroflexota bacterium]
MPAPALLAVGLVLGFLVLIPARRLQLAGFRGRAIGTYAAGLWALSFLVAVRPVAIRVLVPILLVAYIAPFVVAPGRLARIVRRGRPPAGSAPSDQPVKNVTPPDPDEPTSAP